MPSSTQEDYLRSIYRIMEESASDLVKSHDLADRLGLDKATISVQLKLLQKNGWLTQYPYSPIILTPEGLRIAQNLTYKHRIIEYYLIQELKISVEKIHQEAHQLEHAVSDEVVIQMAKKLGNPTHCPHGKKLPPFKPEKIC